jgi:V8-like Glu-specific endopeptidase
MVMIASPIRGHAVLTLSETQKSWQITTLFGINRSVASFAVNVVFRGARIGCAVKDEIERVNSSLVPHLHRRWSTNVGVRSKLQSAPADSRLQVAPPERGLFLKVAIPAFVVSTFLAAAIVTSNASEASPPKNRYESLSDFDSGSKYVQLGHLVGQLSLTIPTTTGLLQKPVCTALAISGRYFITARHCLHDETGAQRAYTDALITLNTGDNAIKVISVHHDPAEEGCTTESIDCQDDFAVMKTTSAIDLPALNLLELGQPPPSKGELFILHYPGGGPLFLSQFECHAFTEPVNGVELRHRCDTEEGSSGAPIFDATYHLIGMHLKSGKSDDLKTFNTGLLFSEILAKSKMTKDLLEAIAHTATPNPKQDVLAVAYTLADGRAIVKRGAEWLIRQNVDGQLKSHILVPQISDGENVVFWDRENDIVLSFPQNGGPVRVRSPDELNWKGIGNATRPK